MGQNMRYTLCSERCMALAVHLGYLLIQSAKDGKENGKQRYIEELLDHFKRAWKLKPIFTLTDKDMAEINTFLAKFPEAKHQLCFWHCLRAIKIRLSILRRRPQYYDAKRAKKEFDWIDLDFVPISQSNGVQEEIKILFFFNLSIRFLISKKGYYLHCTKSDPTFDAPAQWRKTGSSPRPCYAAASTYTTHERTGL